jgi:hypothetical protein
MEQVENRVDVEETSFKNKVHMHIPLGPGRYGAWHGWGRKPLTQICRAREATQETKLRGESSDGLRTSVRGQGNDACPNGGGGGVGEGHRNSLSFSARWDP